MYELTDKQMKNFCKKIEVGEDGILRWVGAKNIDGYGQFGLNGNTVGAHRIAYALWGDEELTPDLFVLHKTDEPDVVDPRLLFLGTQKDNITDMWKKGRAVSVRGEDHGLTVLTEEQAIAIRADDRPIMVIAREYGVEKHLIKGVKYGQSWGWLDTPLVKSRKMTSSEWLPKKLTADDVRRIHQLQQDGVTCREIAAVVGISRSMISLILSGKCWNDVYQEFNGQEAA